MTLDQQMKSGGRGSFKLGETEDYFYDGAGLTPKHKGKNKKKGNKGAPESLAVDCVNGLMDHVTTRKFFLFVSVPDTGAWVNPAPGIVDLGLANSAAGPETSESSCSPTATR